MSEQENKNPEEKSTKTGVPMRTYLIMILAGVYVAYLGVSLCQNVIKGADGSNPGFMVVGVIFIVLGVVFVINGIRGSLRVSKAQKEQENIEKEPADSISASENVEEASEASEGEDESRPAPAKKMSLADRANLVSRMGDVNEEDEEL